MRVAILTDNDFENVNGVTTPLNAVLRQAPPDARVACIRLRLQLRFVFVMAS